MVGEDTTNRFEEDDDIFIKTSTLPSNNITVQPGDVVGYYISDQEEVRHYEGVALNRSGASESVWFYGGYTELPLQIRPGSCQVSVGPSGTLRSFTDAAPILSIAMGMVTFRGPKEDQPYYREVA